MSNIFPTLTLERNNIYWDDDRNKYACSGVTYHDGTNTTVYEYEFYLDNIEDSIADFLSNQDLGLDESTIDKLVKDLMHFIFNNKLIAKVQIDTISLMNEKESKFTKAFFRINTESKK